MKAQTKLQHRKGAKQHKSVTPHETVRMSSKCLGGKTAPPTSNSALLGIIPRRGGHLRNNIHLMRTPSPLTTMIKINMKKNHNRKCDNHHRNNNGCNDRNMSCPLPSLAEMMPDAKQGSLGCSYRASTQHHKCFRKKRPCLCHLGFLGFCGNDHACVTKFNDRSLSKSIPNSNQLCSRRYLTVPASGRCYHCRHATCAPNLNFRIAPGHSCAKTFMFMLLVCLPPPRSLRSNAQTGACTAGGTARR